MTQLPKHSCLVSLCVLRYSLTSLQLITDALEYLGQVLGTRARSDLGSVSDLSPCRMPAEDRTIDGHKSEGTSGVCFTQLPMHSRASLAGRQLRVLTWNVNISKAVLSGQPVPVLSHFNSEVFPHFCPVTLCLTAAVASCHCSVHFSV